MLVTGSPSTDSSRPGTAGGGASGKLSSMGFLKTPQHQKVPSPLNESFTERFSTIIDSCQKKIKLFSGPSTLFSTLVTKARRKDRDCPSSQDQDNKPYLEKDLLERNIPETDLRQLVELPAGLGYEEWLASHTIDFFHHVNLLYGTVCEFCTLTGCPDMMGPAMKHYLWQDEKGKKTRLAAPQYVDYVMTFTQNTLNDESVFPTKFENEFPSCFESIVKKIHRLLFHVFAHIYHSHFRELAYLSLHSHLNCIFAHFVLFNEKFKLIEEKETEILQDLINALKLNPESESSSSSCCLSTSQIDQQQQQPTTPTSSSCSSTSTPALSNMFISTSTSTSTLTTSGVCPAVSCTEDCSGQDATINNNCSSSSPLHAVSSKDDEPLVKSHFNSSNLDDDSIVTSVTATVTHVTAETGVHRPPLLSTVVTLAADTRP